MSKDQNESFLNDKFDSDSQWLKNAQKDLNTDIFNDNMFKTESSSKKTEWKAENGSQASLLEENKQEKATFKMEKKQTQSIGLDKVEKKNDLPSINWSNQGQMKTKIESRDENVEVEPTFSR